MMGFGATKLIAINNIDGPRNNALKSHIFILKHRKAL